MKTRLPTHLSAYGFLAVAVLVVAGFSISSNNFATTDNLFAMLHAVGSLVLASCAIGLVMLAGKIDISIGSIAFVSASVGAVLIQTFDVSPAVALLVIVLVGALMGAINGLLVAYLGISPLIATLGTMIAFRGLGLLITDSRVISLPADAASWGNQSIGPIFLDTIVVGVILAIVHALHRHTVFGRRLTAVGNNEETAKKIGIDTRKVVFKAFVLAGALAGASAVCSFVQVGSISGFLGKGLEFHAIAVAVVGGLSLAGGRGTIFPGIVIGALSFEIIENGLNQLNANPYFYQLITGLVIFCAMYMDAIKTARNGTRPTLST